MKRIFLAVALLYSVATVAQKSNQCGFVIPPNRPPDITGSFSSVHEASDIVNNMLNNIKWQENFTLREQNGINNAYATILQSKRYIVYDNNFLENLDYYAGTDWASISVMAHEMGHHYYNHVVYSSGSTPPKELEADYFSGYVMQRSGASLDQARAAMNKLGTSQASASHPAKADRLSAITNGWNYASNMAPTNTGPITNPTQGQGSSGTTVPTPTPTYPDPNKSGGSTVDNDAATWIYLTHSNKNAITVELSDDGRTYQNVNLEPGAPFVFKYEVYNYGWMRLPQLRGKKVYRLYHGRDYSIQWSRKQQSWVLVEVP
jgi:hypothetical protein